MINNLTKVLLDSSRWASRVETEEFKSIRNYGDGKVTFITGDNWVEGVLSYKALVAAVAWSDYIYIFVDKLDDMLFDKIFENAISGDLLG